MKNALVITLALVGVLDLGVSPGWTQSGYGPDMEQGTSTRLGNYTFHHYSTPNNEAALGNLSGPMELTH